MSKSQSIFMWDNVGRIILIIESEIGFDSKTIDINESKHFSKEDEGCSLQYFRFIRELVHTKKPFGLAYGFKSHCTFINECFSKLEDCLQSRQNNQGNIFPPFGNAYLPPSISITLKDCPILYPSKQKYLRDYNCIYLMSSVLMFDAIIMNILRNKILECREEEDACILQILITKNIICTGSHFKNFTGRKAHTSI